MGIKTIEIEYKNYGKCVCISNDIVKVIVTIEAGPKIVYFGKINGKNLISQDKNSDIDILGHYIKVISTQNLNNKNENNELVIYSVLKEGASFKYPKIGGDDLQLSLEIIMAEDTSDIMVIHSAKNMSKDKKTISLCASTCIAPNGVVIVPQNLEKSIDDMPSNVISLWQNSKFNDPRFFIGEKYITLSCNENIKNKFKFGFNNTSAASFYIDYDIAFIKRYIHNSQAKYPNNGCSFVCDLDEEKMSIETYSPFYSLEYAKEMKHVENWSIINIKENNQFSDEEKIDEFINGLYKQN